MGQSINKTSFSASDHKKFAKQLKEELEELEGLLEKPGWGVGTCTLGAELELYLTDKHARPAHYNLALLQKAADPLMTAEINRFNIEYNSPFTAFRGAPFTFLKQKMDARLLSLQALATQDDVVITPIGILPTLRGGLWSLIHDGFAALSRPDRHLV